MNEPLSAGDICNRVVTVTGPQTDVLQAARLMREHHVGCLVVVEGADDARRVIGMLTDRDIVTSVVAQGLDPARLRVGDVMSANPAIVPEDMPFLDLLRTMRGRGLRRLPVVRPGGVLVGLVALDDTLKMLAEQLQTVVEAIGSQQRRERQRRP